MRQSPFAVLLFITPVLAACGGMSDPVLSTAPALAVVSASSAVKTQPVQMQDQCDPATFNASIGPGTCASGHPGVTFDTFVGQLTARQNAPAWRNAPSNLTASFGSTLVATNRGGEVHSFTKVAAFGGGVVPFLNALAGTPVPAPECLAAPPSEFVGPGGTDSEDLDQQGTLNFQCCIHPWMRTTVTVK